jgi:hypothetical protein
VVQDTLRSVAALFPGQIFFPHRGIARDVMGKLHVKNGTPVGNEHLCKGCRHGQYVTGYRESDVLAFCTQSYPTFKIPFVVHECNEFDDKLKPDWEQMEKLAIEIQPVRISKKTRGFGIAGSPAAEKPEFVVTVGEDDEDCEDVDAVAELELA